MLAPRIAAVISHAFAEQTRADEDLFHSEICNLKSAMLC